MRDQPSLTDLVTRAGNGDTQAWDALVERYAPLIWSICRRHQLADADAGRVGQRSLASADSRWPGRAGESRRDRVRDHPSGPQPARSGRYVRVCAL